MSYEFKCERKKGLFFKTLKQVWSFRQIRYTNKIITAKQIDKLQQLHIYKDCSFNANLLLCDKHVMLVWKKGIQTSAEPDENIKNLAALSSSFKSEDVTPLKRKNYNMHFNLEVAAYAEKYNKSKAAQDN